MLKYSRAVLYVGKPTDKVIKALKKLDLNLGISNNAMQQWGKELVMTVQRKGRRRTKAGCTRSSVDNATVSTLGKLALSSTPG